jgi:PAS domain S-box-containing protein
MTDSAPDRLPPFSAASRSLILERAEPRLLLLFFGGGSAISLLFALIYSLETTPAIVAHRAMLTGSALVMALVYGLGAWGAVHGRVKLAVQAVAWTMLIAIAGNSGVTGHGLRSLPLGFVPIVVCLGCVLVGRRCGVLLALGGALALFALAAAELLTGLVPPGFGASLSGMLATHLLVLIGGLIGGWVSSRSLERALQAATEREQRYRGLLGVAADWYWEQDAELRYTHMSRTLTDDRDLLPPYYLGRTRWEIDELALSPEQWAAHRADLDARRPFRDLVMRRPDIHGHPRWVSNSGEPVFDAEGVFMGYWGVGHELTADALAQRALRSSDSRYRELFARSPSPMLVHRASLIVDANEAAMALFGYHERAEMIGHSIVRHYPPGDARTRVEQRLAAVETLAGGERLPLADFTLERCDGGRVEVQVTTLRVELDDGPATLSIYIDMTARRAAERSLLHSQTLLTRLFDTTPDTVVLSELKSGRYLMLNGHFSEVLGWSAEEAIGRSSFDLEVWHRPADRERLLREVREHGAAREIPAMFKAKSGALVPLSASAASFSLDGIDYLVFVGRDMAAVEQARLEREAILQHASIGIAFTRDRRFVHVNPHFEAMFGWPASTLRGRSGAVISADPKDNAEIGAAAAPLLASGQPFEMERKMRRRDGSLFWCRMIAQAVDRGDPSRGGAIWIAEDVTERRQTEQALAAARDAAEAASRAKSAFLANTSHEIRTPLNGLLGLAQLAQAPGLDAPRRQRYLEQILDSAHSLSAIISDILDFSKIEAGKLSLESVSFALHETLNATCRAYRSLAEARDLTLTLHVDDDVPQTVLGDPVRVRQILGNYLNNALKFTECGGVRVEVGYAGTLLRLAVIDSGCGIDTATQARLFHPFTQADDSTTRRHGGTGLGLSICRELAALMQGEVGVASEPGRGARFWAELPMPAAEACAEALAPDASLLAQRLAGARVLLVEDNAVNMMIARAMLEQWRICVTPAHDGQQAIDAVVAAERAGLPFQAVLMDVQMPVMSGHEAARRLRERWDSEALPIVALTAAALVSEREQALAAGMDDFLTKPIDSQQLQRTLARVMGPRAEA